MAGGKGKSAGGKSAGGKTSSADGPKKQQSHSARAGLQVSNFARLICSGDGCITISDIVFVFATRDNQPRNLEYSTQRTNPLELNLHRTTRPHAKFMTMHTTTLENASASVHVFAHMLATTITMHPFRFPLRAFAPSSL